MMTTPAGVALSYRRVFVCATSSSVYEFLGRGTSFLAKATVILLLQLTNSASTANSKGRRGSLCTQNSVLGVGCRVIRLPAQRSMSFTGMR
jgi:hypothetical protein